MVCCFFVEEIKKGGHHMTLLEQERTADELREFLARWGLKLKYVAGVCEINGKALSRFANHKLALSPAQINRLQSYMSDYERRNSI